MRPGMLVMVATVALAGRSAATQDLELEFSEAGLNRLVAQLGAPSSAGLHRPNALASLGYRNCSALGSLDCPGAKPTADAVAQTPRRVLLSRCQGPDGQGAIVPGAEPVPWQWWIAEARFKIEPQRLSLAASVRYRVASQWFKEERTVPAALRFDTASQRLRMEVSAFSVPITHASSGVTEPITEVDVARHLSFAIPIRPQLVQLPGLDGGLKSLNSRVQGANVEYLAGQVRVRIDAAVN